MKKYLVGVWYSLPVQLLLLHFRRYQVFLIFWYILTATIYGGFMKAYGADSLFLAPEYFGQVSPLSTAFVGFSVGVYFMSWNITTFILHSREVRFLVTTAQPFLKYCINNALLPIIFLAVYFIEGYQYARHQELIPMEQVFLLGLGFIGGLLLALVIAFGYFFGADKTIYSRLGVLIRKANEQYIRSTMRKRQLPKERVNVRVDWFLSARFHLRKPRDVRHYSQEFLDKVFAHQHIAAVLAVVVAFLFLVGVGFTSDARLFQIPAAASVTILFAVLIGVSGAFSLFLGSWSIPLVVLCCVLFNQLYRHDVIDPRNKAYGLNYSYIGHAPHYNRAALAEQVLPQNIETDRAAFLKILNTWKSKQDQPKPVLFIINTSGGGLRSANFTMHALQGLDSMMHGTLMQRTLFINGSSGGLLGAAYFRELYYRKQEGFATDLQSSMHVDDISRDLLNPLFSSFVSRDIIGSVQKFTYHHYSYSKDRGYAFEEKLNENTHGFLDRSLREYELPERNAQIPFMFFSSVISRDGRKMIVSTRPARFLCKPLFNEAQLSPFDADAVDFNSFFSRQDGMDLRVLSALRMNATFPYALPNVWLPTEPVIDVMDAGLRDNFGQETTLRFIDVFKDWLKENTSKVIVLQIRDRSLSDWEKYPENKDIVSLLTTPFLLLQNDWYKLQDYQQHDQLEYLSELYGPDFYRVCFQYVPSDKDAPASLSFHLTSLEKKGIASALSNPVNQRAFAWLRQLMQ